MKFYPIFHHRTFHFSFVQKILHMPSYLANSPFREKSACPRQKNKFSLLHEKGELVNSMYIRKADFLKEYIHAYDNDISYGDI